MQVTVPPDLEALVQKRLASGAFASAEDVIRCALETLEAGESWPVWGQSPSSPELDRHHTLLRTWIQETKDGFRIPV